jgi:hypothetical protein
MDERQKDSVEELKAVLNEFDRHFDPENLRETAGTDWWEVRNIDLSVVIQMGREVSEELQHNPEAVFEFGFIMGWYWLSNRLGNSKGVIDE